MARRSLCRADRERANRRWPRSCCGEADRLISDDVLPLRIKSVGRRLHCPRARICGSGVRPWTCLSVDKQGLRRAADGAREKYFLPTIEKITQPWPYWPRSFGWSVARPIAISCGRLMAFFELAPSIKRPTDSIWRANLRRWEVRKSWISPCPASPFSTFCARGAWTCSRNRPLPSKISLPWMTCP